MQNPGRRFYSLRASGLRVAALVALIFLIASWHAAGAAFGQFAAGLQSPPTFGDRATAPEPPLGTREVPELRTRDTRTYVDKDGAQITRFFEGSLNHRDAQGKWEAIDDTLIPTFTPGYAYRNKANRYVAEFPADLSSPVRFSAEGEWVTAELEGARGPGLVNANESSFSQVLPGVDVEYATINDGLKETLKLAGPASQSTFRFAIRTSSGLRARANDAGGIDFVQDQRTVFSLAPPFMQDSSGRPEGLSREVELRLEGTTDGYVVTLTADSAWLEREERVWPVSIDPTLYMGADRECTIHEGSSSRTCALPGEIYHNIGVRSTAPQVARALFRFDVSGLIPTDAEVFDASFNAYVGTVPPNLPAATGVHRVTQPWNQSVNWSTYDGQSPWAQPGGDFDPESQGVGSIIGTGWHRWGYMSFLVQSWVDRAVPNYGFLLKTTEPAQYRTPGGGSDYTYLFSSGFYLPAFWPYLEVKWQPRGRHSSMPAKSWVAEDGTTQDTARVNAIESRGNTVYIGGDFRYVGPRTGSFVSLATTNDASYNQNFANLSEVAGTTGQPSGSTVPVRAIAPDGSGGWYIGGDFKYVGGRARERLAHIKANGTLDTTWNPGANGTVHAIAVSGTSVFVGGSFTSIAGQPRTAIAKLDATSGAVVANWDPRPNAGSSVRAIAVGSSYALYVGGSFSSFLGGAYPRENIAAIDQQSAFPLAFDPGADGTVTALAATASTVYAGGEFTHVGGPGVFREHIAAISTAGTVSDTWHPDADAAPDALLVSGTRVYAGGRFSRIGSQFRNGIAALDVASNDALPWNPNPPLGSRVRTLALSGSLLYAGGNFRNIGTKNRRYLAALDTTTAVATDWNPVMGDEVYALGVSSDRVFAGGLFRSANGKTRRNLAALNGSTGVPTNFNPTVNGGPVNALEAVEGKLYVGGQFTSIGGQPHNPLASFLIATGALTSWNPVTQNVQALRAHEGRLYVGASSMKSLDGSRMIENAGAYGLDSGDLSFWEPRPNGVVTDLETDGQSMYLAGDFTWVGASSQPRNSLAAVDTLAGFINTLWNPNPNAPVWDIALHKDTVYVGGAFTQIGNPPQPRNYLAALNKATTANDQALPWNPSPNGGVRALEADGESVYVGGHFTQLGGWMPRAGLAAIHPEGSGNVVRPLHPGIEVINGQTYDEARSPRVLALSDERLYVGGDYYAVGSAAQTGISFFNVYGRLAEPTEATRTRRRLTLRADGDPSLFQSVRFEYRRTESPTYDWTTIPEQAVADQRGDAIGAWPEGLDASGDATVVWDMPTAGELLGFDQASVEVRAVFLGSALESFRTEAVKVTLDQKAAGTDDAVEDIGPGTVDLLTGNFNLTEDDVSIDAYNSDLTFTRTYNSRDYTAGTGKPLGPGWVSSLPVDGAASTFARLQSEVVTDEDYGDSYEIVTITTTDGSQFGLVGFEGEYYPDPGSEDLWLVRRVGSDGSTRFELTDLDANITVFRPRDGAWLPTEVRQPGTEDQTTTTYTYEPSGRVSQIYAPGASSADCGADPVQPGKRECRFLSFIYDGAGRLGHINFTAYDQGAPTATTQAVAQYEYDANGRLSAAWDPRISPPLKERYSYDSYGRLSTITPPGQQPWTITYQRAFGEPVTVGRLRSVSRPTLPGPYTERSVAETTVVYGVPLGGSGAPYQMRASDVEQWGQGDFPTDATAIFPPDQPPQGDPPTNYDRATIYYLDRYAREVNVATPGGGTRGFITTAEYDKFNNVVRELTAANRARALDSSSPVTRSREIDTQRAYSSDGIDLTEERGPLHKVELENRQQPSARELIAIRYDEELADELPRAHLPTTVTVAPEVGGQAQQSDARVTKFSYTDQGTLGITLRKPTSVTVDATTDGLNLRGRIVYRAATGLPLEVRMPANPNGGDAHTTETYYYNDPFGGSAECSGKPEWTGLPCKIKPAAQPGGSLPDLPVTTYQFNRLYQVTMETDTAGSGPSATERVTTVSYEENGQLTGRLKRQAVSSTEGASLPPVDLGYDSTTGLLATTADDQRTIAREYDTLGRLTRYIDADGTTSTTTYDDLDRPARVDDGRGWQGLGYDAVSGLLTSLYDSAAGRFTATYDEDGEIIQETYPNLLQAQTTYDEAGTPVRLKYVKGSNTWLDFSAMQSIHGQWMSHAGTLSSQEYTYDDAGRLTQVKDTVPGQGCTRREYFYDNATEAGRNSNRTRMISGAPCDAGGGGSTVTYSYDAADRITNPGFTYDKFGRTLAVPAAHAGGSELTSTYYVSDLVRSMTQDGTTHTLLLDPTRRPRMRQVTGQGDETIHYSDDSDSPSFDEVGTRWRRYIGGIGSGLAAIQEYPVGTTLLQLENLHGDIVATADTSPAASGPVETFEATEFGVPRQQDNRRYGWLGTHQRATELPTGIVEMGARVYVPQLGRFLQVDPIYGGSANAYDYVYQDPLNEYDLEGECGICVPAAVVGVRVGIAVGKAIAKKGARRAPKPKPKKPARAPPTGGSGGGGKPGSVRSPKQEHPPRGGHRKGTSKRTKGKHERGEARRKREQERAKGGQKGGKDKASKKKKKRR